MKPSLLASLLLLLLILTKAQGARLGKGFISSDDKQHKIHEEEEGSLIKTSNGGVEDHEVVHDCKDDGHCSSGTMKRRVYRVAKKNHHHWLPWTHEDYNGPRNHKPKHH